MILVIIPCLNEAAHLEDLVRRLLASNDDLPLQVVIADGGSTDGSRAIAHRLAQTYNNVALLDNPKRLQGAALNRAVSVFGDGKDYFIRMDAHADYPPNFCRALLAEAESTQADAIVVAMKTVGKNRFQRAVAAAQNSRLGNGGSAHRSAGLSGCWVDHGHHALMRTSAFRAVDGYDEQFSHNEDAEFDIRFTRAGYSIWLTRSTGIDYFPRTTPVELFHQYFRHGQGRALTLLKHRLSPRLRQAISAMMVPAALLALVSPLFWAAAVPFSMWILLCLCYGVFLAIDTRRSANLLSGPAALLMHAGWSLGFWTRIVAQAKRGRLQ